MKRQYKNVSCLSLRQRIPQRNLSSEDIPCSIQFVDTSTNAFRFFLNRCVLRFPSIMSGWEVHTINEITGSQRLFHQDIWQTLEEKLALFSSLHL